VFVFDFVCVKCTIQCLPYTIKLFILTAWKFQQMLLRHVARKEGGQKLLLKDSHVHMDILMNHLKDFEKMQREKC